MMMVFDDNKKRVKVIRKHYGPNKPMCARNVLVPCPCEFAPSSNVKIGFRDWDGMVR